MSTAVLDQVSAAMTMAGDKKIDGFIKLAILAVGGQGGGVLTNWIVDLAEQNGYVAQSTSVPGVAQRTGATVYYIEMCPVSDQDPVFALMPSPGDVDIVVAAEAMEAGRAVTRGFVSPDRTTLIASSHRMFAVSEKIVPGDGITSSERVIDRVGQAAQRVVCHDLAAVAADCGAHVSASLFGALAGAQCLPFERHHFEETIRASGRGVEPSLRAFGVAYGLAKDGATAPHMAPEEAVASAVKPQASIAPEKQRRGWHDLLSRCEKLPAASQSIAQLGLAKVVDYQDLDYGKEYLDQLIDAAEQDSRCGGADKDFEFTTTLAKYLANAMCYDDVIRVADLKTRSTRYTRIRDDLSVDDDAVVKLTEYMHPRAEEVVGLMPSSIGRLVERQGWLYQFVEARCRKGRRWRSDALGAFFILYTLGGLRRWRRNLLRHEREVAHFTHWLGLAKRTLEHDYDTAVAILRARRLIKGYSDTHARGLSKYDLVLRGIELVKGRPDAAAWADRLTAAALSDVKTDALDGVIQTIRSFSDDADLVEAGA